MVIWVWVNTYRYIFSGMNIHLPAILGFTRYQGFDTLPYNGILMEYWRIPSSVIKRGWKSLHLVRWLSQLSASIYRRVPLPRLISRGYNRLPPTHNSSHMGANNSKHHSLSSPPRVFPVYLRGAGSSPVIRWSPVKTNDFVALWNSLRLTIWIDGATLWYIYSYLILNLSHIWCTAVTVCTVFWRTIRYIPQTHS